MHTSIYPLLSSNVKIVYGKKRTAIYNFDTKKVYFVSLELADFLEMCNGIEDLQELLNKFKKASSKRIQNFLKECKRKKIITLHNEQKNYCTSSEKRMKYPTVKYEEPRHVWLEITWKCTLKCRHCYCGFKSQGREELPRSKW